MISHLPTAIRTARIYREAILVTHAGSRNAHAVAISMRHIEVASDVPLVNGQQVVLGIELDARIFGIAMITLHARVSAAVETSSTTIFSCHFTHALDAATQQAVDALVCESSYSSAPLPWQVQAA